VQIKEDRKGSERVLNYYSKRTENYEIDAIQTDRWIKTSKKETHLIQLECKIQTYNLLHYK